MGCRVGAKNTLVKNYLWYAERAGAQVIAETEVADIRPSTAKPAPPATKWRRAAPPGGWRAPAAAARRGVVVAGGALAPTACWHAAACRRPAPAEPRLGEKVRTNSESSWP